MSTRRVLRWLFSLLISVMLIAIIVPVAATLLLDQEDVKTEIANWIESRIGRQFDVDGAVGFRPGLGLVLFAEGIRLENASWGKQPDALRIERVEVRISLVNLLRGRVLIEKAVIRDGDLWVEKSESGEFNLIRMSPDPPPIRIPDWLDINELQLIDLRIDVDLLTRDWLVNIEEGNAKSLRRGDPLQLDLEGSLNTVPLSVNGTLGTLESWLAREDSRAELEVLIDDDSPFEARGRVGDVIGWRDLEVDLSGVAGRLRDITPWFRGIPIDLRDLSVSGRLVQPGTFGSMRLEGMSGSFRYFGLPLNASGMVERLARMEGIDISLGSRGAWDLAEIPLKRPLPVAAQVDINATLGGTSKALRLEVIDLSVIADGVRLSGRGLVGNASRVWDSGLPLTLEVEEVAELGKLLQRQWPQSGTVSGTATLIREESGFSLREVYLASDEALTSLEARGEILWVDKKPVGSLAVAGRIQPEFMELNNFALPVEVEAVALDAGWQIEGSQRRLNVNILDITLPGGAIRGSGEVPDLDNPGALKMSFAGRVDNPQTLAKEIGWSLPEFPELDVAADLHGDGEGNWRLEDIAIGASRGEERLAISGSFRGIGKEPEVFLELAAHALPDTLRVWLDNEKWDPLLVELTPIDASLQVITGDTGGYAIKNLSIQSSLAGAGLGLEGEVHSFNPMEGGIDVTLSGPVLHQPDLPLAYEVPAVESVDLAFHIPLPWNAPRLEDYDVILELEDGSLSLSGNSIQFAPFSAGEMRLGFKHRDLASLWKGNARLIEGNDVEIDALVSLLEGEFTSKGMVRLGDSSLEGSFDWRRSGSDEPPTVQASLHTDNLDLQQLLLPEKPRDHFLSDQPLLPPWLSGLNGEILLQADRFRDHLTQLHSMVLVASLLPERKEVTINGKAGDGRFQARVQQGLQGDTVLDMEAGELPVSAVLSLSRNKLFQGGFFDAEIQLSGKENSLRGLMSRGSGQVRFDLRETRVYNRSLETVGGDLVTSFLEQINPFQESREYVQVECGAIYLDVEDGVASTRNGFALKTDRVTVLGGGDVRFPQEEIRIILAPKARKGFGISASSIAKMVRLGGTLKAPRAEADTSGLVKSGVAIGAAIMSGGLSLIALGALDRLQANDDVCAIARGEVVPRSASRPSDDTESR